MFFKERGEGGNRCETVLDFTILQFSFQIRNILLLADKHKLHWLLCFYVNASQVAVGE